MQLICIFFFKQPRSICSWLFFFIISTCLGQSSELSTRSIIGIIKSDKDSIGIEGVHLYIRNTAIGTITNTAGEFEIKIPAKFDLSKTEIIISSIGYKTNFFIADSTLNKSLIIYLESIAYLLEEVVVSPQQEDSSVYILNEAIHSIQFNYPRRSHLLEGFYRAVSTRDTSYTRLIEAAIRVQEVGYQKKTWEEESLTMVKNRVKVIEIRKSDDFRERDFLTKALMLVFGERNDLYQVLGCNYVRILGRSSNHVMSKDNLTKYISQYNGQIEWDGQNAYSISLVYSPAKGFQWDNINFIISKSDFAILRIDLKRMANPNRKDIPKESLVDGKYFFRSDITYRKINQKYYPVLIHTVGSDYDASNTVKIDGKVFKQSSDQIFLLTNVISEDFSKIKWKDAEDRDADLYKLNLPYNEDFWRNYNTVKINPLKRIPIELQKRKSLEEQFKRPNKNND
jgi:hypothetical protein